MAISGRNTTALEEVSKVCQEAGVPQDKVGIYLLFDPVAIEVFTFL